MSFLDENARGSAMGAPAGTVPAGTAKAAEEQASGYVAVRKQKREAARKAVADLRKLITDQKQKDLLEVIALFVEAQKGGGGGFGNAGPSKFEQAFGKDPQKGKSVTFAELTEKGIAFSSTDTYNLRKKGIEIEITNCDPTKVPANVTGVQRIESILKTGKVTYVGPVAAN